MKIVVAVTGIALYGFLVTHLAGNLLVFKGAGALTEYGKSLRELGPLLWVARLGLLGAFILHVWFTIRLTKLNRAASPNPYAVKTIVRSTWMSRYMIVSGLVVLGFVIYHLGHFTFRVTDDVVRAYDGDLQSIVVKSFQSPIIVGIYVICLALLAAHLAHGVGSLFQTLGLSRVGLRETIHKLGIAVTLLLILGFISIPIGIYLGFVPLN
jgi:succinate dehydrogenase / fumarate reductase cytochrome b subunit